MADMEFGKKLDTEGRLHFAVVKIAIRDDPEFVANLSAPFGSIVRLADA